MDAEIDGIPIENDGKMHESPAGNKNVMLEQNQHHSGGVGNQSEVIKAENDAQWGQNVNFHSKHNFPPSFRGRGGANSFMRGGRGGMTNFNARNAIGMEQNMSMNGPPLEFWVETKTEDGKSYYYHGITRETTWTKPEGPNVKIIMQSELEEMNKKQQQMHQAQQGPNNNSTMEPGLKHALSEKSDPSKELTSITNSEVINKQPPLNMLSQPPPSQTINQPPPNVGVSGAPPLTQQPPPVIHQQPPPFFQPGMHPPNFGQPPFGMPPPGYGAFPGGPAPWNMPWNQHMHPAGPQQEKPAKNLIIKPGVIDPAVIARAAEWSEHRAPDGRPYYYHAGRGESVWEKPQALRDMEAARMAAHSGAAPQQITPAVPQNIAGLPHMMANQLMHIPPAGTSPFDSNMVYNAANSVSAIKVEPIKGKTQTAASITDKESKKSEEKRKKDDEQKKTVGATKAVDKSRPILSTPIAGTPWCVVWTGDARVFFYNPSTRSSVWERPEELIDREDVDKAVCNPPDQLKNTLQPANEKSKTEEESEKPIQTDVVEEIDDIDDDDDEVIKIRTESESSVEEVPTKKSKLTMKHSKKTDANEAAVEAEVRAAKERALVPLETRVKQFKEMLREKDVSAFSTWEKELHKIVFDPRYLLLTSKERKQVFEKYVKDRAEEERKEKRNKMRQKRDEFRKLMEDAKLHGKSSFSDFCQRYGRDERFRGIEKIRERESLFNEYIVDVRRREKEEKQFRKEQVRRDFFDMLRERSDIDRNTRWHDIKKKFDSDSRYRALDNTYREEYFLDYVRIMKEEKRRQRDQKDRVRDRERERERERDRDRRNKHDRKSERRDRSRSRDKDRSDKESKEVRDNDKETDKNGENKKLESDEEGEHRDDSEHNSISDEDESERLQKERERKLRAEQSIREREKEVQRALAGHLRDRDKERKHHKRDEAIGQFNALLTDLVRNTVLTWKEVKKQLRKDHRWELIESLDRDDRERIYNEHIDSLMKKKREKFREMLDEITTLELTSPWKDIKKLIKEDPRYLKYSNSDRCEREFRDYLKDKYMSAKIALRELLQECKLITHKSIELVKENPNHLKEIQDILKNDKRYLVLDHMTEERTSIVVSYLEELHKRGPPPPPTASESSRRNK